MAQQPQVSVVIPSYNNEEYIVNCMKSVLTQTLDNIEVLCVDAGSTDGTIQLVKDFAKTDERVKVFLSYKQTVGGLLNHGISIASGRYVTFVNVKSTLEENMLESLNNLSQTNYIDIIQGLVKFNNEKKTMPNEIPIRNAFNIKRVPNFIKNYISIEGILFKRSFLIHKNMKFVETDASSICEDFFHEATLKAATIKYTDEICSNTHKNNVSEDLGLIQFSNSMSNLLLTNQEYNDCDNNVKDILYEMIFKHIDKSNISSFDYDTAKCLNELFNNIDSEYVRQKLDDDEKHIYYKFKSPLILSHFNDLENI